MKIDMHEQVQNFWQKHHGGSREESKRKQNGKLSFRMSKYVRESPMRRGGGRMDKINKSSQIDKIAGAKEGSS